MRLGKRASLPPRRRLRLAAFARGGALSLPESCDWTPVVSAWPMFCNDTAGTCTVAALGHAELCDSANNGRPVVVTDADTLDAYARILAAAGAPYDPADADTDTGAAELDALAYVLAHGLGGRKIAGYGTIDHHDPLELRACVAYLGGAYVGLQLPLTAQDGPASWVVPARGWRYDDGPGTWGGHAVAVLGYNARRDTYTVVSWGQCFEVQGAFVRACIDEAHGVIFDDWVGASGRAPSGYDMAALVAELRHVSDVPVILAA
jgi:hypothetical protein